MLVASATRIWIYLLFILFASIWNWSLPNKKITALLRTIILSQNDTTSFWKTATGYKHNHFFQKDPAVLVAKSCKMGNVQISSASIIHLVMVMGTAIVMEPHVYVKQALAELTVPLICKVMSHLRKWIKIILLSYKLNKHISSSCGSF